MTIMVQRVHTFLLEIKFYGLINNLSVGVYSMLKDDNK